MKIKYFTLKFAAMLVVMISIAGCKPEIKDIGPAYTGGAGIYGTWKLSSLKLTDETMPVPEIRDMSSYYNADESRLLIIRFDEDKTYSILQPGLLPRTLGTGGTWQYDVEPFPTSITFSTNTGSSLVANLNNLVGETDINFGFSYTRSDTCGNAYATYNYTLTRQQ